MNENHCFTKKILALTSITLITACSDYRRPDDFKEFQQFKQQDIAGEKINCQTLNSTKIKKKKLPIDSSIDFHPVTYEDNILDFIYEDGYRFKQCSASISEELNRYCTSKVDKAIEQFTLQASWGIGDKYVSLCSNYLTKELQKINYTYNLPTEKNKFLTINHAGVMIDPARIVKIHFQQERESLWSLTIDVLKNGNGNSISYPLYYGKKDLWKQARIDFSEAATAYKNSK